MKAFHFRLCVSGHDGIMSCRRKNPLAKWAAHFVSPLNCPKMLPALLRKTQSTAARAAFLMRHTSATLPRKRLKPVSLTNVAVSTVRQPQRLTRLLRHKIKKHNRTMTNNYRAPLAVLFLLLFQGCTHVNSDRVLQESLPAMQASTQNMTRMLAVYEPWFGHPSHISVGYSSNDPETLRRQIDQAKTLGISGFIVDWYGHREPLLDRSYGLLQSISGEKNFQVAMMYDESRATDAETATDE